MLPRYTITWPPTWVIWRIVGGLGAEHDLRVAVADGVEEVARGHRRADAPAGRLSPAASTPIPPVSSAGTYGVRSTVALRDLVDGGVAVDVRACGRSSAPRWSGSTSLLPRKFCAGRDRQQVGAERCRSSPAGSPGSRRRRRRRRPSRRSRSRSRAPTAPPAAAASAGPASATREQLARAAAAPCRSPVSGAGERAVGGRRSCALVRDDLAVAHLDPARERRRDVLVVGDQHQRRAVGRELVQQAARPRRRTSSRGSRSARRRG